ncbi:MAG: MoaD/ThiS family protein [Chloroflexota bacterium]
MKVNVVFFGDFAKFKPASWSGRRGTVDVPDGATIDTLADHLGLGEEPCVVMLNEEQHHRGAELHDGDTVTFLPPIAGGGLNTLERSQRVAAEQLMEDEAWRDRLEDDVATPLLDWALAQTDAALARMAAGREVAAAAAATGLEERAYEVAGQARRILTVLATHRRGPAAAPAMATLEPLLGPPLFASPDRGQAAVRQALAAMSANPAT